MDIKDFTKKELKNYINENGFFFNMVANSIDKATLTGVKLSENAVETGVKLPEGENIMVFKGLASQNYDSGEKNRNGYKIDPNGWTFVNYKKNPIILLQHCAEDGGIGKALSFEVTDAGLNILFYVDLNTLEEKSAYQVKNGYISAISTGHITLDDAIEENDSGDRVSVQDAIEKFGWDNVWRALCGMSDLYTYVVTKAEAIENSLVTIGSNEKAIAMPNAIGKFAQNKYSPLLDKFNEMKKAQEKNAVVTNDEEVVETPEATEEVVVEAPSEVVETPAAEATSEENKAKYADDEEEPVEDNAVETNDETETPAETAETQPETVEEATDTSSETPAAEEAPAQDATEVVSTENNISVSEYNSLKNEVVLLREEVATKDNLITQAATTIEQLNTAIETKNAIIERAKNYVSDLGKGYNPEAETNEGGTILEKRMRKSQ